MLLPTIIASGVLINPWCLLALLAGGVYVTWRPYRRLFDQWEHLPLGGKLAAFLLIPAIIAAGDLAKMLGYPVGVFWRIRNHPPDWRIR